MYFLKIAVVRKESQSIDAKPDPVDFVQALLIQGASFHPTSQALLFGFPGSLRSTRVYLDHPRPS